MKLEDMLDFTPDVFNVSHITFQLLLRWHVFVCLLASPYCYTAVPCVDEISDRKVEPPPEQDVVPRKAGDIRVQGVLRLHQQSHRLQKQEPTRTC